MDASVSAVRAIGFKNYTVPERRSQFACTIKYLYCLLNGTRDPLPPVSFYRLLSRPRFRPSR